MTKMWAVWLSIVMGLAAPSFAGVQDANIQKPQANVAKDLSEARVKSPQDAMPSLASKSVAPDNNAPLPEPDTALWRLQDDDTTIYLLGTVHLFVEGTRWQNNAIRDAIETSGELVLETTLDVSSMKLLGAVALRAFDASQPRLLDRLPDQHRVSVGERIDALTEDLGVSRSFFDKLDTWAVAFMIDESDDDDENTFYYSGAETELEEEFSVFDKPIGTLETWESQLDIFDKLSDEAQNDWLISTIATEEGGFDTLDDVISAWTTGNVDSIDIADEVRGAQSAEILEALLYRRNRNWVDWIVERLDTPGTVLIAVGAGHLAGTNSVQDYLGQRGILVERIR